MGDLGHIGPLASLYLSLKSNTRHIGLSAKARSPRYRFNMYLGTSRGFYETLERGVSILAYSNPTTVVPPVAGINELPGLVGRNLTSLTTRSNLN